MSHLDIVLTAVKSGTLLLGSLIVLLSWRAYRRTGAPALRALTVGFGLITVGAIAAGVGHQFTTLSLAQSVVIESALTFLGFAVIVYSLYIE